MSSRGSFAKNMHITCNEYETIKILDSGVKILKGIGKNHTLPDYSHSPNAIYAKLHKSGDLQELRFYDDNCELIFEIGYHREGILSKESNVLHFHIINKLNRSPAQQIDTNIKEKYKVYLKEFGLYD